ncbi:MAG: sigma-70 family RNA polymerase sigma factor [Anaerolineaceae bacterium]|nr:sigma-70 family RNA polymerase sigma factor [Anaerolineaceae bacterium]
MNEKEAIRLVKEKNLKGLAYLVQHHQLEALRTATLLLADRHLAEDLVQNAFIRFYDKAANFDSERPFKPYFMRMIVNEAIKIASRNKPTLSFDEQAGSETLDILDPNPLPEEVFEAKETQTAVWLALQKLPPDQRAVIVMRFYLEMTENEIKEALGSPLGTIKWRLYRARSLLASLLRDEKPMHSSHREMIEITEENHE